MAARIAAGFDLLAQEAGRPATRPSGVSAKPDMRP